MLVHYAGDNALLVDTGDTQTAHRLRAHLESLELEGIRELIPGLSSLLVIADSPMVDLDRLAVEIPAMSLAPLEQNRVGRFTIEVTYDGPDLDKVCAHAGLSRGEVIRRHVEAEYTVAFLGFAPGFPYLTGLAPALRMPRLDRPRTRVPPGSVAIADSLTVIYPTSSAGGFNLIGRTRVGLFDARARPPSKFAPGDRVRFRSVG